jgi:hypothetical protein
MKRGSWEGSRKARNTSNASRLPLTRFLLSLAFLPQPFEMGKRMAIFYTASLMAGAFGGILGGEHQVERERANGRTKRVADCFRRCFFASQVLSRPVWRELEVFEDGTGSSELREWPLVSPRLRFPCCRDSGRLSAVVLLSFQSSSPSPPTSFSVSPICSAFLHRSKLFA